MVFLFSALLSAAKPPLHKNVEFTEYPAVYAIYRSGNGTDVPKADEPSEESANQSGQSNLQCIRQEIFNTVLNSTPNETYKNKTENNVCYHIIKI